MKINVRQITINAMIAALYFVLTIISSPISFMGIQFRIAEILVLLCFFRKDYIIGVTLGCLFANIISPLGGFDVLFGTFATFLSCLGIMFMPRLLPSLLFPIVINGVVVGLELFLILELPFWISFLEVMAGETVVLIVGYFVFFMLRKRVWFYRIINAKQNVIFKW